MEYYGHTADDQDGQRLHEAHWQLLRDHLRNVARLAKKFAEPLGLAKEAELAGLLHDLGKYSARFQARLHDNSIHGVNHWAAGTAHGIALNAWAVAFACDGHHTGIPALNSNEAGPSLRQTNSKFGDSTARLELTGQCPEDIRELLKRFTNDGLQLPTFSAGKIEDKFAEALRARMLLSCLVDADRLDTENHFDPEKSKERITTALFANKALSILLDGLKSKPAQGPINALRRQLLEDCLSAAEKPAGLFTLTAPTGSGKTLSSLAFALRHIAHHNAPLSPDDPRRLRRMIVVIPFTSIIEQTARVFRELFENEFGGDYILEHHSAVAPRERKGDQTRDNEDERIRRARLAAENWASPLVVTTNVQFFESLFSNRPSDCRKLHNMGRSVILFDEVQTLPPHLVPSLLSGIHLLTRDYGSTAVFMTATQPAFDQVAPQVLPEQYNWRPTEISSNPGAMAETLQRTRINIPARGVTTAWTDLAQEIAQNLQALCVLNTTKDARELFRLVKEFKSDGAFHLSARMCPSHRQEKLSAIRESLTRGEACRLISTQLIEAGVDVDFPVAYRAFGPLDSIIQTAGRCNREGRHLVPCPVNVFRPVEIKLRPGAYALATAKTEEFIARHPDASLHQPAIYREYFSELYNLIGPEKAEADKVFDLSVKFDFPAAAEACRLVGKETRAVLVKWKLGAELAKKLEKEKHLTAAECREAQRYSVNLYQHEFLDAQIKDYIYQPAKEWDFWVWNSDYDENLGLGHLDTDAYNQ